MTDDEILDSFEKSVNRKLNDIRRQEYLQFMSLARQDVINTIRLRGFIQLADRLEKEMRK